VSLFRTPKKSATISSIFLSSQLDPKASREKGNFVGSHAAAAARADCEMYSSILSDFQIESTSWIMDDYRQQR
jgi:hypothetical protein